MNKSSLIKSEIQKAKGGKSISAFVASTLAALALAFGGLACAADFDVSGNFQGESVTDTRAYDRMQRGLGRAFFYRESHP